MKIGADGPIYPSGWVEIIEEKLMAMEWEARGLAVPEEIDEAVYEMQLVHLP